MDIPAKSNHAVPAPRILGIVSAEALTSRRYPEALWTCGGAELRADGVPVDAIVPAVRHFQGEKARRGFSGPVFFTLRLQRDGGAWPDDRAGEREAVWRALPVGACDFADLEIEEIARVSPAALASLRDIGARLLISHHAFAPESPATWPGLLDSMRAFDPAAVKFAVTVLPADVPAILGLARKVASGFSESCVLGMHLAGMPTRLLSPLLGCPFTYGYLGAGPVAPGQLDAETMRAFFARAREDFPGVDTPDAELLEWADALLKKVVGA